MPVRGVKHLNKVLLKAEKQLVEETLTDRMKEIISLLFKLVVGNMPVDKGHHRKNINLSRGAPDTTTVAGGLETSTGAPLSGSEQAKLASFLSLLPNKIVHNLFLSGTGPAMRVIEDGLFPAGPKVQGGYSAQAVGGVMKISVAELRSRLKVGNIKIGVS